MKKLAVVVALLAIASAVVWMNRPERPAATRSNSDTSRAAARAAHGSLTSDAVLAIAPGRAVAAQARPVRAMSPTLQAFYSAKSYAPLYGRLKAAASRTPEEQWILAEVLTRCASVDGEDPRQSSQGLGLPGARERFVASIAANDPDRDKRIAAFDAVNYDECAPLGRIMATRKEIRALLEAGAAGGDPKARAAVVLEELEDSLRGPDGRQRTGPDSIPAITDAQVNTLREVFASGDPLAMRSAASLMMLEYANMSLRDSEDRPLDRLAFGRAAILLTCDYGLPCGPEAQWVTNACMAHGQCSAAGLRDHMMFYNSSPGASQVMAGYEEALRNAARDANWSFFHFYPGPNPQTAVFQPRGGP